MREELLRLGLVAWALGMLSACSPGGVSQPPPVEADLRGTSADVSELIGRLLAEARAEPASAERRGALGMAYEVNGLALASVRCYEQAERLDPAEPRWSYYLATARAAMGDLEGALEPLERALALAPDYAPAYLYRGQWLMDLGQVAEAAPAFRRASELQPQVPAGWIGQARVQLKRGQGDQAARILENLIRKYNHPYIYQLLGLAYRQQGDLERARAAFARGKPVSPPGWPDPWHNEKKIYQTGFGAGMVRAEELMSRGKLSEAVEVLEGLREQRPGDVALLNNLSVVYRRTGKAERSLEVLEAGLETNPDYFPFHLNLANAYQARGDLERALWHLDRAIEINPTLGRAYEQKGTYLLRADRRGEALEAFNSALRYDAGRPQVFLYAGILEAERGNWLRAAERLEQALQLDPGFGEAYVALGTARAELGEFDAARRAFDRAAALVPDDPQLAEGRQRLQELRARAQ